MLTSLNQMLSRMDALVPDGRCLRAGGDGKPRLEEDETRVLLQMPKSDFYHAYELNLNKKSWDYTIWCRDKAVRINRFFACLLFENIRAKVMKDGWNNTQRGYGMPEVNAEELRGLIQIAFQKDTVSIRKCDLVRCAFIANTLLFWEPVRMFLCHSLDKELSVEICHLDKGISEEETTLADARTRSVRPNRTLPNRYSFGTKAVTWVDIGEYYGYFHDGSYQAVVSADTIHGHPQSLVNVLPLGSPNPRILPMPSLYALRSFDAVTAKVGYPATDNIRERALPENITAENEPRLVGRFYIHHPIDEDELPNDDEEFPLVVFVLEFAEDGRLAYITHPLMKDVSLVHTNELRAITVGEGAADADACARANLILNAGPVPYEREVFSTTPCTNIAQLTPGKYCESMFDPHTGTVDIHRRQPTLYLGPAPDGKAYVYDFRGEEAIVDIAYLYPQIREQDGLRPLPPNDFRSDVPRGRRI
jgi:hypothetical protein